MPNNTNTSAVEAKHGWVFYGPDGNWRWSPKPDHHESVEDLRPATPAEEFFASLQTKAPDTSAVEAFKAAIHDECTSHAEATVDCGDRSKGYIQAWLDAARILPDRIASLQTKAPVEDGLADELALGLVKRTVGAAQTFRIAAQAATFGDEIRPTKELVEAVNQLFASLPSPQAISQLEWVRANALTRSQDSEAVGLLEEARAFVAVKGAFTDKYCKEFLARIDTRLSKSQDSEAGWRSMKDAPRDGKRPIDLWVRGTAPTDCGFSPNPEDGYRVTECYWCNPGSEWFSAAEDMVVPNLSVMAWRYPPEPPRIDTHLSTNEGEGA